MQTSNPFLMEEVMNKWLANAVANLNGFIAGSIILIGVLAGVGSGNALVFVTSTLTGVVIAVMLCGLIAVFVDIRDELVRIRKGETAADSGPGYHPNSIAAAIRGNTIVRTPA
jgi:hypothetical protein